MMEVLEPFHLAVLDVENLRQHYARTLEHWLARYEQHVDEVRAMFDEPFVRAWRLYLSGSVAAFHSGRCRSSRCCSTAPGPATSPGRGGASTVTDASERCDALVVGAGPGGSSCARALHAAGLDVVVIDRSSFPRDKVCAGWIMPRVLDALQIDPVDYARGRTWQPITAFRTGRIGGRPVETDYARPVSYGIRRCEFDDYLLRRSGARLILGEPVREIVREGKDWVVNGHFRAPMLVGAGGHAVPSPAGCGVTSLCRSSAARRRSSPSAPRRQAPWSAGCPRSTSATTLPATAGSSARGLHQRGLGRDDPHDLPGHVQRFCDWLRATGRLPACPAASFKGHAYRLYDTAMPVPWRMESSWSAMRPGWRTRRPGRASAPQSNRGCWRRT